MEERFLSNSDIKDETQENSLLSSLLEKVMVDLNMYKKCVLTGIIYNYLLLQKI